MVKKLIRINYKCENTLYMKTFRIDKDEYEKMECPFDDFEELLTSRKNAKCEIVSFIVCSEDDKVETTLTKKL
jgi:hypothetical protein